MWLKVLAMTRKRKRYSRTANDSSREPQTKEDAAGGGAQPVQQDELEALRTQRDDLLGRLQRVSADYMNYQKRVQKDVSAGREFANEQLMKSLLTILDDMERAMTAARENHDEQDPLLQGMQLLHDKMLDTLGTFGLSVIEAEGEKFDPERHSAMMQEGSDEHPPMTVLRELQRGYELKGRTLRPSSVVVSKGPDTPSAEDRQEVGEQESSSDRRPQQTDSEH